MGLSGLTLVILPRLLDPAVVADPEVGRVITDDIRAPFSIEVLDEETTSWAKKDAQAQVRSVYDLDQDAGVSRERRINESFARMRELTSQHDITLEERRAELSRYLGVSLEAEDFDALTRGQFSESLSDAIIAALDEATPGYVVASRDLLLPDQQRGITIRTSESEQVLRDVSEVIDLEEARRLLSQALRQNPTSPPTVGKAPKNERRLVLAVAERLLRPNLVFNREESERRKLAAANGVRSVVVPVQQGELVAKRGDALTRRQALILKGFAERALRTRSESRALGTTGLLAIFALASLRFSRGLSRRPLRLRDGVFAFFVLVAAMVMIRVLSFLMSYWDPSSPVPYDLVVWAAPFAFGALLVRTFLAVEVGLVVGMVSAVAASVMFDGNLVLLLYVLSGGLIAATPTRRARSVWRVGFEVSLVQGIVGLCGLAIANRLESSELLWLPGVALVSGLGAALVTAVATPVLEASLGFTTDTRLRELAELDQPLLKQLLVAAPGTYHHSVVVAQMTEAAAVAVGARPLLVRVAALYHDVGKLDAPSVYRENRRDVDELAPAESDLRRIENHTLGSLKYARQAKLGSHVMAVIAAHHGTRKVARLPDGLRYSGPKPDSKEAVLLMVADSAEAAARQANESRPEVLATMVDEVIDTLFREGELAESDLSFRELAVARDEFVKILSKVGRAKEGQRFLVVAERQERADGEKSRHSPSHLDRR